MEGRLPQRPAVHLPRQIGPHLQRELAAERLHPAVQAAEPRRVAHVHQQLRHEAHAVVAHRHRDGAADGAEDLPGRLGSQEHAEQQQGGAQLAGATQLV